MKVPVPRDETAGTRDKLILAAVSLFQSRGYHAVGVAQILEAAGVPKGSLYHHFPGGKEELGVAAVHWLRGEMVDAFHAAASKRLAPETLVSRLFDDAGGWLERNKFRQGALLAVLAQEAGEGEEQLREATGEAYEAAATALAGALSPDDSETAQPLARTVLSALDGAVAACRATRSTGPMDEIKATMLPLVREFSRTPRPRG